MESSEVEKNGKGDAQPTQQHSSSAPATKMIRSPIDLVKWKRSKAFHDYMDFLRRINESIVGVSTSQWIPQSPGVQKVLQILEEVKSWTTKHPPEEEMMQRYGNKAFRKWYDELQQNAKRLLKEVTEDLDAESPEEILYPYLLDSFGNQTRIDYGSGHEAAFLILLLCLEKIGLFTKEDSAAIGIVLFGEYLRVCRHLQRTYKMEPAGSHGVHSLDDYQFVPFLWGSSQLRNTDFSPDSYPIPERAQENEKKSLFLEAIVYINETKTGPFHEHSNQLWNISGVPSWDKVNSGLLKMVMEALVAEEFDDLDLNLSHEIIGRSDMELGDVTQHNVQQLKKLNQAVFPVVYNDKFYREIINAGELAKYAYFNDIVVGAVCCRYDTFEGGKGLYIMTLGTLAPYRNLGIGRMLLEHVFDLCKNDHAITNVFLHVQVNNETALDFYKKNGFEIRDVVEKYYKRIDPDSAYLVVKKIER
ncbi:unnamed protein product, partial [Mesorhabditis belari]|uniref:Serine/threonine-protein phosphatase 2A activator n=1 Tax=Mesorhabditis belari TaxID=2138241 RepID=A0AAF3F0R6_9BILA